MKSTGLLFYAERVYSTLTGLLFVLIVTRSLSPEEFGAWSVISTLLSYATVATVVNYWVTRLRSRGVVEVTVSGLALSLLFALASSGAYLVLLPYLSGEFGVARSALLVSTLYIPVLYVNGALYSSLYAVSPARAAVSEFLFETGKTVAAVLFALSGGVSLVSALIAVLAGHILQGAFLAVSTRRDLVRRPSAALAKRVLSLSTFNFAAQPSTLLSSLDVPLISAVRGNLSVAYYTVVNTFSNLVGYSGVLSKGLYPSLLSVDDSSAHRERIEESLRLVLLVGIPAAAGVAALAPNLLYLLRPDYVAAANVLRVAAVTSIVASVNGVFSDALQGVERADLEGKGLREVARSRIFKVFALGYVKLAVGLPGVVAAVYLSGDPLAVALLGKASWLAAELVVFAILLWWIRGHARLGAVARSLLAYSAASVPAVLVALAVNPYRIREAFLALLLAGATYFGSLYVLDPWFRSQASRVAALLARRSPPSTTSARSG
ncbi:oligosaccharide flippase family protein [Thermofilum pendens]|uniref:Polysaccharide biosynthesis protein n=1 Tax=Thermofilum pendens (strain DSM 2475 / Hrk 5) TaxID=368408 RepID=A1S132_THEPD|nr:oligosaccharide flippase family protein [Thermofilum pendens]ABL79162.1 polysaccharide biosynthesis protein [Thermofilum pendens Hrk 5]